MKMPRHMRDTGSTAPVALLYANKDEEHIAFREELSEMQSAGRPPLQVIHVLSLTWIQTGRENRDIVTRDDPAIPR